MPLVSKGTEKIILGAVALGAVGLFLAARKGAQVVKENINLVNPASDENLAYRGVNAVGAAVSDDENFDLGKSLFCFFNPNAITCNPERALLNKSQDTSQLSDEQVSLLLEQEREFIENDEYIAPAGSGSAGFIAPQQSSEYELICTTDSETGEQVCKKVLINSTNNVFGNGTVYY